MPRAFFVSLIFIASGLLSCLFMPYRCPLALIKSASQIPNKLPIHSALAISGDIPVAAAKIIHNIEFSMG